MKLKKLILILPLVLVAFFAGCAESPYSYVKPSSINVTVADGEQYYLRKNTYTIERGEDLTVTLVFRNGYIPDGCSYRDYELRKISPNEYNLMLFGIRYPEFIKVGETNGKEAIRYFANGGEYTGEKPVEEYVKGEVSANHLRTNTDLGFRFVREGYLLTGWNTRPDASGEHIGLGSRVTVSEEGATELFAEWEKVTDADRFEYERTENGIYLTKYTGEKTLDKLVLPAEIGKTPVIGIRAGFLKNAAIALAVIPKSVKTVEPEAFIACKFDCLCFFDSLSGICDESLFRCTVKQVRINAASYPRYQKDTEICYFAEEMDRLIFLKDKKKIICFSGCSFAYGLNSPKLAREIGKGYDVVNLGMIGGTNAGFQFDIISNFVGEGDVFVHAPEAASPYQLMAKNSAEIRMFVITEGNYDLLSLVKVSKIDGFFTSFASYCKNRAQLEPQSYENKTGGYNEYGDIVKPREFTGENKAFTEDFSYTFKPEFVNEESANLLASYYDLLRKKGAKVLLSFSPINYHGLPQEDRTVRRWEKFESNVLRFISEEHGVPVISSVTDFIFEGKFFFDTDYHLNEEGARLRTERLIADLKAAGV